MRCLLALKGNSIRQVYIFKVKVYELFDPIMPKHWSEVRGASNQSGNHITTALSFWYLIGCNFTEKKHETEHFKLWEDGQLGHWQHMFLMWDWSALLSHVVVSNKFSSVLTVRLSFFLICKEVVLDLKSWYFLINFHNKNILSISGGKHVPPYFHKSILLITLMPLCRFYT